MNHTIFNRTQHATNHIHSNSIHQIVHHTMEQYASYWQMCVLSRFRQGKMSGGRCAQPHPWMDRSNRQGHTSAMNAQPILCGLMPCVAVWLLSFLTACATPSGPPPLEVTLGEVQKGGQLGQIVRADKMRGVSPLPTSDRVGIRFRYLGPTDKTSALASGQIKRQAGLKLRAESGCNLIYVMWRAEPVVELYVAVKSNPGLRTHKECGNGGYTRLKAIRSRPIGTFADQREHVLSAVIRRHVLLVEVDGELVWAGFLPPAAQQAIGHVGVRTDNVSLDFALTTTP